MKSDRKRNEPGAASQEFEAFKRLVTVSKETVRLRTGKMNGSQKQFANEGQQAEYQNTSFEQRDNAENRLDPGRDV